MAPAVFLAVFLLAAVIAGALGPGCKAWSVPHGLEIFEVIRLYLAFPFGTGVYYHPLLSIRLEQL